MRFAFGAALVVLCGLPVARHLWPVCDYTDEDSARLDLKAYSQATEMYRTRNGRLPGSLEELVPAHVRTVRADPWKGRYELVVLPDGFAVRSRGRDGLPGTSDDLELKVRTTGAAGG